jgi:hypothetical protein
MSENRIMLTLMFGALRRDMAGKAGRAKHLTVAEHAAREEFWQLRERGVNPRESAEFGFEAGWKAVPVEYHA